MMLGKLNVDIQNNEIRHIYYLTLNLTSNESKTSTRTLKLVGENIVYYMIQL